MYVASNSHWLVLCIGAIAVMFTWLLAVTVLGAIENRDVNMPLLDKLLSDCLGSDVHERLKAHAAENKVLKGHLILFALPLAARKGVTRIKALSLFGLAFGTSILVDVSMVLAIWGGYIEARPG